MVLLRKISSYEIVSTHRHLILEPESNEKDELELRRSILAKLPVPIYIKDTDLCFS